LLYLRFNILLDTKQVLLEMLFPPKLLVSSEDDNAAAAAAAAADIDLVSGEHLSTVLVRDVDDTGLL